MSVKQRVYEELKEVGFLTLYFFAWFITFLYLKKLLLEQYSIEIKILSTALIGALVVAKVVLILGKTSFGNLFPDRTLFVQVMWRSVAYTAIVLLVTFAELVFDRYREVGELSKAFVVSWQERDIHHFFAMSICVALSFVVFNTFAAISNHMGEGRLRKLFFESTKNQ